MGPLIEIRCIPFQYEMVVNDARLEMQSPAPQQKVTRQDGGFSMQHNPARLKIDSSLARESLGHKGVVQITQENAKKGVAAAQSATGMMASEGNQMMNSRNKDVFGSIGVQRTRSTLQTMLGFLPSTPSQVSFDPHELKMKYQMDKLSFDWRANTRPDMRFTPASIEFQVKNYARVEIEYTGGPIYVPKSSEPGYTPPFGMDLRG